MKVTLNSKQFEKEMNNIINYSIGFLDGAKNGKTIFLDKLGKQTINVLKEYIDTNARVNPQTLHHIYEWYRVGSPSARLYDINYTVSNIGLSLKSTFKQSSSVQNGSRTPFYDKARIMENGISVTIKPKNAQALRFMDGGEEVFTKGTVTVTNPGGQTQNQFEKTFNEFMTKYFTQSFLRNSGILDYIKNPIVYKQDIAQGKKYGRSKGLNTGFKWITNMKVGA